MNIKKVIIWIVIILFAYSGVIFFAIGDRGEAQIDVVAVNDITESLAAKWNRLEEGELPGLNYGMDYVVIDWDHNFIVATKTGLNNNLNSAISNQDTIVDIRLNDKGLGKLIIYNNINNVWQHYRKFIFTFSVSLLSLVAIICLTFILHFDRLVFRPFRKLQGFARLVAEGKLDMPLDMDKGNMFGAFTESFDLMREELNRARENERIANQSKKELVASLSHDIKTPVASIKAVSEVMYAKSEDESAKKQLEVINAKADQINTLITNMFNATLEELQELKVTVSEQSSQVLFHIIKNADYYNRIKLSSSGDGIVIVDILRLEQVIDNVISNSYKYAGTSMEVDIHIKGQYLEIEFKDYGLGVLDEELPLIFNKFYRANNSDGKSGTGLGLYIAKYLMNKMGGNIECENVEDGFILRLKLLLA